MKNEILVISKGDYPVVLFPFTRQSSLVYSDLRNLLTYIVEYQNLAEVG